MFSGIFNLMLICADAVVHTPELVYLSPHALADGEAEGDFTVIEVLNSNPLEVENHNDDDHRDDYEVEAHSTVVSVLNSEGVFTRPRWSVSAQRREMNKSTYYGKNETENQLETHNNNTIWRKRNFIGCGVTVSYTILVSLIIWHFGYI
jgi:hypothetical protein